MKLYRGLVAIVAASLLWVIPLSKVQADCAAANYAFISGYNRSISSLYGQLGLFVNSRGGNSSSYVYAAYSYEAVAEAYQDASYKQAYNVYLSTGNVYDYYAYVYGYYSWYHKHYAVYYLGLVYQGYDYVADAIINSFYGDLYGEHALLHSSLSC